MRAEDDVAGALPTQRGLSLPVQVSTAWTCHECAAGEVDEMHVRCGLLPPTLLTDQRSI